MYTEWGWVCFVNISSTVHNSIYEQDRKQTKLQNQTAQFSSKWHDLGNQDYRLAIWNHGLLNSDYGLGTRDHWSLIRNTRSEITGQFDKVNFIKLWW